MKTNEEVNTLKDESLEKVVGGVINAGDNPGNNNNPGNNDNPGDNPIEDPTTCSYFWDKGGTVTCNAPITLRTKEVCKYCTAQGFFTLK